MTDQDKAPEETAPGSDTAGREQREHRWRAQDEGQPSKPEKKEGWADFVGKANTAGLYNDQKTRR